MDPKHPYTGPINEGEPLTSTHLSMSRIFSALAATAAVCVASATPVYNDPKRKFYEDEKDIYAVPGTTTPASAQETELLGPRSVVNGVTVRSTSAVESAFRAVRESVYGAYTSTEEYLNDGKERAYQTERQVTSTVSSLHNKSEDLLPNSIYIVIAALSGSIIARRRGVVARAFLPVALGLGAFKYLLPQTFANTSAFLWKVEQRSFPELADTQTAAVKRAEDLAVLVEQSALAGQQKVTSGVESLRRKISQVTGLTIDEDVLKK